MEKIALVTGASQGIGASIALRLAQDGFSIWLNYQQNHAAAKSVQEEIDHLGGKCLLLPFDVAKAKDVENALAPLLEHDVPYAFISNAGLNKDTVLGLMSYSDWDMVLRVHLDGFFNVSRLLIPLMQRQRKGRIVTIASTSGQTGLPGQVNYSAAKAGLIGATKALAKEVGKRNILVNAVAPGLIATKMTENLPLENFLPHIPLGRIGTPSDVANCVSFLCSKRSNYITGQVLAVNGGLYM